MLRLSQQELGVLGTSRNFNTLRDVMSPEQVEVSEHDDDGVENADDDDDDDDEADGDQSRYVFASVCSHVRM